MQVEGTLKKAGYAYAHNDHLGYITSCPSNVGTGLRASVMLRLPKLYKVRTCLHYEVWEGDGGTLQYCVPQVRCDAM